MALVVEDGTGKSDADSYLSVADADTYHAAHGQPTAWENATDVEKEQALRLATQYLDSHYRRRWQGYRASQTQALMWPRSNVYRDYGYVISSTTIPVELEHATAEAAMRSISETDGLMPDIDEPGSISREQVTVGEISYTTEYAGSRSQTKRFRIIDDLLAELLVSDNEVLRA